MRVRVLFLTVYSYVKVIFVRSSLDDNLYAATILIES
jgi:hypothetical protein